MRYLSRPIHVLHTLFTVHQSDNFFSVTSVWFTSQKQIRRNDEIQTQKKNNWIEHSEIVKWMTKKLFETLLLMSIPYEFFSIAPLFLSDLPPNFRKKDVIVFMPDILSQYLICTAEDNENEMKWNEKNDLHLLHYVTRCRGVTTK